MWDIEAMKSRSKPRCGTSRLRSPDRSYDVGHRGYEVQIEATMWDIEATKSRSKLRCGTSRLRSPDRSYDVGHRSEVQIEATMWDIEATKCDIIRLNCL